MARRIAVALALAVAVALAACGCGRPSDAHVVEIRDWNLEVRGRPPQKVTLPAHVEDQLVERSGARATTFTLHATVGVPPEMRGRDLTLAIPTLAARAHVIVDDHHVFAIDAPTLSGYREALPQRFRIPAERSDEGSLDIEIVVTNAWLPAAWLDTVPRLSATLDGDEWTNVVRAANYAAALVGTMATVVIAIVYGALFLLDRRRRGYGWQGAQSACATVVPAFYLGVTQRLFGAYDLPAMGVALAACGAASIFYTHAQFDLPRPPRATWLIVAAPVAAVIAWPSPFAAVRSVPIVLVAVSVVLVVHVAVAVRALRRRPRPWALVVSSLAWPVGSVVGLGDFVWWLGRGDPWNGLRGAALATVVVSVVQVATLLHEHAASLRRSDELNVELAARVRALEETNVEVKSLNEELRRQIAARSQQLAESLAQSGGAPPASLAPGDVVEDRYRVVRPIGSGGMGSVYLVERLKDGRRFALKVHTSGGSGAALARLAREAQLASTVAHPNVVGIVDVDVSQSGVLYIVMEYVDGKSLAETRERFGDAAWATAVLGQIAEGLAAIHAASIVHRDLKPANVLVADGVVKIADFGISALATNRAWDESGAAAALADTLDVAGATADAPATEAGARSLTATGAIMGTPLYMAPEAARGARQSSAASDLFAFGVIAFELYSGKLPFDAAAVVARLRGRSAPPPPSLAAACPGLDERVVAIVERCMSVDPAARPTAREVAETLARAGDRVI